jgi:glucosamine-6-phosphate deaminase
VPAGLRNGGDRQLELELVVAVHYYSSNPSGCLRVLFALRKMLSAVEKVFLERSKLSERYEPIERATSIEVANIYELGRLVALRFVEWVAENPCGVVALPTGRTPEYFIKTLELMKSGWSTDTVKAELLRDGIKYTPDFPDTSRLTFVM